MEEGGDRRTGRTARPAGYAIGGKTGTAETIPRKTVSMSYPLWDMHRRMIPRLLSMWS